VLLELLAVSAAGAVIGCGTGLLPSLHVNTLAVLLLAGAPIMNAVFQSMGFAASPAFLVAALILSISIAHTFVNIVPATYLGAPDESTALSVLPGHQMLLHGSGYRAVQLSALASQAAVIVSVAAAVPFQWLLSGPIGIWEFIRTHLFWLVLLLALLLIILEPNGLGPETWPTVPRRLAAQAAAIVLLLLSSWYGWLLGELPYKAYLPVPPSPLLPALSGLFGGSTVLTSLTDTARVPHQFLRVYHRDLEPRGAAAAMGAGIVAGATMSVLPGLTNASATALATTMRKGSNEETIVSLSAVNTANAMFNLAVLYFYGRTRSGAVVAMKDLWSVDTWHDRIPVDLANFGIVSLLTGFGSMLLTLWIGRFSVRRIQRIPYRGLSWGVLAYMIATVAIFTGAAGLLVFAVGIAIGILPVKLGIRRVALTGVLLGPVLVYLAPDFTF
jgi:putative membrane protein